MDGGEKSIGASESAIPGVCGETPVISLKLVRAKEGAKLQQGLLPFMKKSTNQTQLAGVESTCASSELPGLLAEESAVRVELTPTNSPIAALPVGTGPRDATKPVAVVHPKKGAELGVPVTCPKATASDPTKGTTPLVGVTVTSATCPKGAISSVGPHSAVVPKLSKKEWEDQKAERERVKAEMKAKKEEERLKREREKQLREQEKKERQVKREKEAKERQEKREREELEKKERREKREAEKRKKDEEKQKKLEEKRKLEQEKEQKEEEKLHREKQAKMKFRGYFGKVEKPTVTKQEKVSNETILTEFSVKDGMSLAKAPREPMQSTSEFDELVAIQASGFISEYIHTCKSMSRKQKKQQTMEATQDDSLIMISDSSKLSLPKFKLLQFKENYRPAYYGSWQRAKGSITPRNPLKKDESLLDYKVESDDEWEEEEPGESISSSEGEEKDGDAEGDDSDEDDGFFVPHGYLSNDEGDCSDSGEFIPGPNDDRSEMKRRKQLAKAWEAEFARKCQPLEAKIIGCIWLPAGQEKFSNKDDCSFLVQFAAVPLVPLPISTAPIATKAETSAQKVENQGGQCSNAESQKQPVPEEAMPDLIRFLHKSALDKKKLVRAFRIHWGAKISTRSPIKAPLSQSPCPVDSTPRPQPSKVDSTPTGNEYQEYETASKISKRQMEKKIQAIAMKEVRPPIAKAVWYVHDAVLKQYGLAQEDFAPLIPDGSPCLSIRSADQMPSRTFATPETPVQPKASKRKSGCVGKSLLDFLSRSPADKSSCQKYLKVGASASPPPPLGEVIILDPPKDGPLAKRQCMNNSVSDDCSGGADVASKNTMDQDVIIVLDPPDSAGSGLGEPPAKKPCLKTMEGETMTTSEDCGSVGGVASSSTVDQNVIVLDPPITAGLAESLQSSSITDAIAMEQGIQCS